MFLNMDVNPVIKLKFRLGVYYALQTITIKTLLLATACLLFHRLSN